MINVVHSCLSVLSVTPNRSNIDMLFGTNELIGLQVDIAAVNKHSFVTALVFSG